jgi:hypothetical protein
MVSTRKRTRNEEDPQVKKEPRTTIEKKTVKHKVAPVKVKSEDAGADSPDATTLNGLTVQQPFASAIIFGVLYRFHFTYLSFILDIDFNCFALLCFDFASLSALNVENSPSKSKIQRKADGSLSTVANPRATLPTRPMN